MKPNGCHLGSITHEILFVLPGIAGLKQEFLLLWRKILQFKSNTQILKMLYLQHDS